MKKFVNGVITGAVATAGTVAAINMMGTTKKKEHMTISGTLHKLGDMAGNIKK